MPLKDYEKHKEKERLRYYKNRRKRILYQREYDKKNKDKKKKQDAKRYKTKRYNKIHSVRNYSRRKHLPILLKKYKVCQFCGSDKKLEIHHTKYTKNIKDCLLLCQSCHKKVHRKVFKLIVP